MADVEIVLDRQDRVAGERGRTLKPGEAVKLLDRPRSLGGLAVAHSEPDIAIALDRKVATDGGGLDRLVGAERGDVPAPAVTVEPPAVVGAGDRVVRHVTQRQCDAAVRATIVQRGRGAIARVEQHDRLSPMHASSRPKCRSSTTKCRRLHST